MRSIKNLICLIVSLLSLNIASAQDLSFKNTNFDFGKVQEDGGKVSHSFLFENKGETPVVIIAVQVTCGCTATEYSRRPIAKGGDSEVKVTYDPMYRPGPFAKSVKVVTSEGGAPYILTISGDVEPRVLSIEEAYPFDMGGSLRIANNYFNLSQVEQGEPKEAMLSYTNTSSSPIEVELRSVKSSGFLEVDDRFSVAAGERSLLPLRYRVAKSSGYYGSLSDKFDIYVDGVKSRYQLLVSGHAVDFFTQEQRNSAGCANIDKRFIKFAEIKRGKTSRSENFSIENIGVERLEIRRVECEEGVEVSIESGDSIAAGELKQVQVSVATKGFDFGNFSRYITLTTNDPERPIQRVRVTGIVVE